MLMLADSLAMIALLALTLIFTIVLMDELDPDWDATPMRARLSLLRWLGAALVLLWLLALAGGMGLPGWLVSQLSASLWSGVVTLAVILGVLLLGAGLVLLLRAGPARGSLRGHVIACQIPYVALLAGLGTLQAALGSH